MWRMKRKRKTMKTMSPLRVGSSLRTGEPVDTVLCAHGDHGAMTWWWGICR
jgi:hypothetical protein